MAHSFQCMTTDKLHTQLSQNPSTVQSIQVERRAVLLFTRSPHTEAQAKPIERLELSKRVRLFTALTRHTIKVASRTGFDLIVATDAASPLFNGPETQHILEQRGKDFGERLQSAVRDAFALGYSQLAIIGNDSPELDADLLRNALQNHAQGSIGLCRASDGGVTLVTLDRNSTTALPELFTSPSWETSSVFADLTALASSAGILTTDLGTGRDIDSACDLIRVAKSPKASALLSIFATALTQQTRTLRSPIQHYTPSSRRTLRTCRQKAPPLS